MKYLGLDTDYQDIAGISLSNIESRNIQKELLSHPNMAILDTVETGWTQETAGFAYDTTDFLFGTKSGKLTTTSGSFNAVVTKTVALNLSGKTISLWFKKSSTITGITIFMLAPNWSDYASFSIGTANYPNNTWFNFVLPVDSMTKTGSPNFSNVATLRIEALGSVNTATLNFDQMHMANSALSNGAIIITFDDGNDSDYVFAKGKMDAFGLKGVSFVTGNLIGTTNFMSLAQMKLMQSVGWDISSHSWSHPYYTSLTGAQMIQETVSMKHYLKKNGFASGARFFAYPYSDYNELAVDLVSRFHLTSRATVGFSTTGGMCNVPMLPSNQLPCVSVINTTSVANLTTWIQNVKATNSLGCILFHRLVTSAPSEWQYLDTNFNSFIDALAASGVPVITLSDLVDKYILQPVQDLTPYNWLNLA